MSVKTSIYPSTHFAGVDPEDHADLGYAPGVSLNGTRSFTIQMVVLFETLNNATLVGQDGVYALKSVSNRLRFEMAGWPAVETDPNQAALAQGTWQFLVVTFDGRRLSIYIGSTRAGSARLVRTGSFGWSTSPHVAGRGLRGRIVGVQNLAIALSPTELDQGNFAPGGDWPHRLVQYYDFTKPVPSTIQNTPIGLNGRVRPMNSILAFSTPGLTYIKPLNDSTVTPGARAESYSVLASFKVPSDVPARDAVFKRQALFASVSDTDGGGMSLNLTAAGDHHYTLELMHGSGETAAQLLAREAVAPGTWYDVAAVYSKEDDSRDGSLRLYVNGEEVVRGGTRIAPLPSSVTEPYLAGIPGDKGNATQCFFGNLLDVYVWARALGGDDIRHYLDNVPNDTANGILAGYKIAAGFAVNSVTNSDLALLGDTKIVDEPIPEVAVEDRPHLFDSSPSDEPEMSPLARKLREAATQEQLSAQLDVQLDEAAEGMRGHFSSAEELDDALGMLERLREKYRDDPLDFPHGIVLHHEHDGYTSVVIHRPRYSLVLHTTDPSEEVTCLKAILNLVFEVVVLLLSAIFNIYAAHPHVRNINLGFAIPVAQFLAQLRPLAANLAAFRTVNAFAELTLGIITGVAWSALMYDILRGMTFWVIVQVTFGLIARVLGIPLAISTAAANILVALTSVVEAARALDKACSGEDTCSDCAPGAQD